MREQSEVNPVEVTNESKNDSKIESEQYKSSLLYFVRMKFWNAEHLFFDSQNGIQRTIENNPVEVTL